MSRHTTLVCFFSEALVSTCLAEEAAQMFWVFVNGTGIPLALLVARVLVLLVALSVLTSGSGALSFDHGCD